MISLLDRAAGDEELRRHTLKDDHGRMGEDLAHGYLRRKGCTVVALSLPLSVRRWRKSI
jgi:hypothetical protein